MKTLDDRPLKQAVAAFSFITIPSIRDTRTRLSLYLETGQVWMMNHCLGQAEACFKAIINNISKGCNHDPIKNINFTVQTQRLAMTDGCTSFYQDCCQQSLQFLTILNTESSSSSRRLSTPSTSTTGKNSKVSKQWHSSMELGFQQLPVKKCTHINMRYEASWNFFNLSESYLFAFRMKPAMIYCMAVMKI